MESKKINNYLNYWIDQKIMFTRGSVANWYQMMKRIEAGQVFQSGVFSRILFTDKEVRDLFDSFVSGEDRKLFTSDDMGRFGFKNNYFINQAIYEGKFIKFTRLGKPILYIKN